MIAGGGTIIASKDELKQFSDGRSSPSVLVVYDNDAMLGTQDTVLQRQAEAKKVACRSQAITPSWVVDSIASGSLQPFARR